MTNGYKAYLAESTSADLLAHSEALDQRCRWPLGQVVHESALGTLATPERKYASEQVDAKMAKL